MNNIEFIISKVNQIDAMIQYEPASYEFINKFNRNEAIDFFHEYFKSDLYCNEIYLLSANAPKDVSSLDDATLYFCILWLKQYLLRREVECLKLQSYKVSNLVNSYQNITMCNNLYFNNLIDFNLCQLYHYAVMFVPETILCTLSGNVLTAETALEICNDCIDYINNQNEDSIDNQNEDSTTNRDAMDLFNNFRQLLLNQHPFMPNPETIRNAYEVMSQFKNSIDEESQKDNLDMFMMIFWNRSNQKTVSFL